jgi:Flp pilus assembly protein TadB
MGDEEDRIRLYEQEIARLDHLHTELEGLWDHVPRYALLALLAPLVWYFAGFGWAVVELLVTAALVATQAYLIGVRKNENRWNRELVARDLDRLRRDLARQGGRP